MGRTRKNDPATKRARVLKAARELFVEQGYYSTSMSQIAQKSGVTQSMIHYYYDTKQGLFEAVIGEAFQPLFRERVIPKGPIPDFKALVRAAMIQRFRFFQKNPDVVKLLSRTLLMDQFKPSELAQRVGGRWVGVYHQAQKENRIRSDIQPEYIMIIYLALTTYWFQDNVSRARVLSTGRRGRQKIEEEFLEAIISIFLESLHIRDEGRSKA